MEEFDIPEGFEIESIPEGVDAPLAAPEAQAPATPEFEVPEGFEVEQAPAQPPVWERENVVPREPAPAPAPTVDPEGRTLEGPSAGVPIGEAADNAPLYVPSLGAPSEATRPEFLEKARPEPSVPDEGEANREIAAELPLPADNMYDGMSHEEANQVYDAYRRHPGVQKDPVTGAMSYKGKVVYQPELTYGDFADPNIPTSEKVTAAVTKTPVDLAFPDRVGTLQRAGHAIADAGVNTAKTALAIGDTIRDYTVGPEGLGVTGPAKGLEAFEGVNPVAEGNVQSTSGQFFDTAVEMGVGIGAGGAAVKAVMKKSFLPSLQKSLTVGAGRGAGTVASMDEGTDSLVVGKKAMIPIFQGFNIDPNDPRAEQLLAAKGNLLIDALATGAAGEAGAGAVKGVGSVVKSVFLEPLGKVVSNAAIKKDEVKQMVRILGGLGPNPTPEEYSRAAQELQTIVRNNKELSIQIGEKGIDDITMKRDPLSAIQRGGDDAMADRAGALKGTALRGDNPALETAQRGPTQTLKTLTDQTQEAFGGDEAIERTRSGVVQQGREEVGAATQAVDTISENIQKAEIDVANLVKNDPGLGGKLSAVSGETDFNPQRFKNESTDKIVGKLKTTYETMSKKKDEMFAKIGDKINMPDQAGFDASLATVKDSLSPQTLKAIEAANGKFGPMFNQVRQMIRKDAQGAITKGDHNQADAIMKLHDNIYNDQVEGLVRSGGPQKTKEGQAALDAIKYYKEEYAPIWNEEPLSRLASTYRQTVGRGGIKENTFKQTGSDIVQQNITNDRRFMADNIVKALGDDSEMVTDYVLGDAASNIAAKVRTGTKLSDLEVKDIVDPLVKYGDALPDGPGKDRINAFVQRFAEQKGNIKGMQEELDIAVKNAKQIEKDVYDTKLSDFFSRQTSGEVAEQIDGYRALTATLRDPNRSGDFKTIVDTIHNSDDPLLKKGLQVAYARYVDEALMGGADDFSKSAGKGIEGGWNKILSNGREVFRDKPNLAYALERVVQEAGESSKDSVSKVSLDSSSKMTEQIRNATNGIITAMFGVLNKTAARVRIGVGAALRRADRSGTKEEIFSKLVSDSDYFDEAVGELANAPKAKFESETKRLARRILSRSAIRMEPDDELSADMQEDVEPVDQTEEAFGR